MKLVNIEKEYHNKNNNVKALKGINLEINNNGITVFLGPSGCGKTTLLNIISGKDKDFSGEVVDVPTMEYVTQEFNLFESMSVEDNLRLIVDDQKIIDDWLNKFDMIEHKKKAIRKCSNGQKRRIQMIRALLLKTKLILCDEPTSALDFENANLIMDCLKENSKDCQIILVTHDIALAEKYADRIIKMDKGIVIEDTHSTTSNVVSSQEEIHKKDLNDTIKFILYEIKSRYWDYFIKIALSMLCILTIFATLDFYRNVKAQSDYHTVFKKGGNLVLSTSNESRPREWEDMSGTLFGIVYPIENVYQLKDIQKVIKNHPEIMAVESFYSYQYELNKNVRYFLWKETDHDVFKDMTYDGDDFSYRPQLPPFLLIEHSENTDTTEFYLKWKDIFYKYPIAAFNLVNEYELPLIAGNKPNKDNEVIISKNLAEIYMKLNSIENYDDLVGSTMILGVCSSYNWYSSDGDNTEVLPADEFEIVISGISSVENKYLNMMFFNDEYPNNMILNHYVKNQEKLYFDYVRFLIDPTKDIEKIASEINEELKSDDRTIGVFNGEGLERKVAFYKNPASFVPFVASLMCVMLLILVLTYIFDRKRIKKENGILSQYGYSTFTKNMLNSIAIMLPTAILSFVFAQKLVAYVNKQAMIKHYEQMLTYNIGFILLAILFIFLFHLAMTQVMTIRRKR